MRLTLVAATSFLWVATTLVASCGDDCSRASDCSSQEVCVDGTCQSPSAAYLSCDSVRDCGDPSVFVCQGGRCTFRVSGVNPDLSVRDVGTSTTTDGGMEDAEPTDGEPSDMAPADAGDGDVGGTDGDM